MGFHGDSVKVILCNYEKRDTCLVIYNIPECITKFFKLFGARFFQVKNIHTGLNMTENPFHVSPNEF